MSELYSIEKQTLTDIGDALRRRHGETKMGTVIEEILVPDVVVSKSPNATGFLTFDDSTYEVTKAVFPYTVTGASSIKVRFTYNISGNYYMKVASGFYNTNAEFPLSAINYNGTSTEITELIFENTQSITIYLFSNGLKNIGYYAEISGLDENGNSFGGQTIQVEKEVEVPNTYSSAEMAEAIDAIETGEFLPEEAFKISGNCQYRFSYGGWDWFIDMHRDKITTENITNANYMFSNSYLKAIPLAINFSNQSGINCGNMFMSCLTLEQLPTLNIPNAERFSLNNILNGCNRLRDANGLFENEEEFGASWSSYINTNAYSSHYLGNLFQNCYSLRTIPSWFYSLKLNPESTAYPAYSYAIYNNLFYYCYVLDEAKNIPVWKCKGVITSNMLNGMIHYTCRLKDFTFETNEDGTPIITEWKTQTIDLSYSVGFASVIGNILNYNSGITEGKQVKDDATYQALKNDPDWWTTKVEYSRYNHNSAVNTINSLPDTSAYLATAGGTNTIKFKGISGSATDGGAINTLTEEEIAVATAKGWTVTFA